jgi:hypothetical protein
MPEKPDFDVDDVISDADDLESAVEVEVLEDQPPVKEEVVETSIVKANQKEKPQVYDAGDKKLMSLPGVSVIKFGEKVSRFPLERLKFPKDRKSLISIISLNPITIKCHFNDTYKSYLCFGKQCCEVDALPRVKYLFPVIVYDTNAKGAPVSFDLDLQVLSIGDDQYEQLITIHNSLEEQGSSLTKCDLVVSCTDEKFQKITFTPNGGPKYKHPKFQATGQEPKLFKRWQENKQYAYRCVARQVDPKTFEKEMGLTSDGIDFASSDMSVDDILD